MTDVWVMLRGAARARLNSLCDAYSGFSHLRLGDVAKELMVINTVLGLVEWEFMPQGCINGPTEFQHAVNDAFQEMVLEEAIQSDALGLAAGMSLAGGPCVEETHTGG